MFNLIYSCRSFSHLRLRVSNALKIFDVITLKKNYKTLCGLARYGHIDAFKSVILHKKYFTKACKHGRVELVDYMMNRGFRSLDLQSILRGGLYQACKGGHEDIIERLIKYDEYNCALRGACIGGQYEIASRLMGEKAPTGMSFSAAFSCNQKIVDMFIDRGCFTYMYGLHGAAGAGCIDMFNKILPLVTQPDEATLEYACGGKNREIIDILVTRYPYNPNEGLKGACYIGDIDLVRYMISLGANAWTQAFAYAFEGNHFNIMTEMIERGANVENGLMLAKPVGDISLLENYVRHLTKPDNILTRACICDEIDTVLYLIEHSNANPKNIITKTCKWTNIIDEVISHGYLTKKQVVYAAQRIQNKAVESYYS